MQDDATGQVRMRLQSDRRKLRINKWVWHGVAMDPSEMCGSEPPKLLKSYSWIDEIPQHDTPGSTLASPKKQTELFFSPSSSKFSNCHVAETAFHEASKHLQASKNEAPQSIAEHVVVIAPENLVKRCFLMFPEGGYSASSPILSRSCSRALRRCLRSKALNWSSQVRGCPSLDPLGLTIWKPEAPL